MITSTIKCPHSGERIRIANHSLLLYGCSYCDKSFRAMDVRDGKLPEHDITVSADDGIRRARSGDNSGSWFRSS